MADLNPIAKRIHNVQPDPVRIVLESGDAGVYRFDSTEFFQREFRGEGRRIDADADADYRLITSEDYERVLLGRSAPDVEGWEMMGAIAEAEPVEE
jgi:hypothetical protein